MTPDEALSLNVPRAGCLTCETLRDLSASARKRGNAWEDVATLRRLGRHLHDDHDDHQAVMPAWPARPAA